MRTTQFTFHCTALLGIAIFSCLPLKSVQATDARLKKLSPATCVALAQSAFKPKLSTAWQDFLPFTHVCPLNKVRNSTAEVYLVSVFADDFYRANPNEKNWQKFPLPLLLASSGKCLAQLPELYPSDQPRELNLHFGQWKKDIPSQIAVKVSNPAVGGDYHLPTLYWDSKQQQYHARKNTDEHKIEESLCPT